MENIFKNLYFIGDENLLKDLKLSFAGKIDIDIFPRIKKRDEEFKLIIDSSKEGTLAEAIKNITEKYKVDFFIVDFPFIKEFKKEFFSVYWGAEYPGTDFTFPFIIYLVSEPETRLRMHSGVKAYFRNNKDVLLSILIGIEEFLEEKENPSWVTANL